MRRRVRYLAVVVIGFGADLGLALLLHKVVGLDLTLAAASGFVGALLLNYLLFEVWAFRNARASLSGQRLTATAGSALIALGVRLTTVAALNALVPAQGALTAAGILVAAAGLSLLVNWTLISRVFAKSDGGDRAR